jgi:hypothetical protein
MTSARSLCCARERVTATTLHNKALHSSSLPLFLSSPFSSLCNQYNVSMNSSFSRKRKLLDADFVEEGLAGANKRFLSEKVAQELNSLKISANKYPPNDSQVFNR